MIQSHEVPEKPPKRDLYLLNRLINVQNTFAYKKRISKPYKNRKKLQKFARIS